MKCPIFQVIRDFLISHPEFKGKCFLKEAKTSEGIKQFYKIIIPKSHNKLIVNNEELEWCEHHVSIYEDQSWSEKNYKSTYHYTGTFINTKKNKVIIHVYFNSHGEYLYIHVKDDNNIRIEPISESDQIKIRAFAEAASIQSISLIQNKAAEISDHFETKLNEDVKKLEEISKNFHLNNLEVYNQYHQQLNCCLRHFDNLKKYTYYPQSDLEKIFQNGLKFIAEIINRLRNQDDTLTGNKKSEANSEDMYNAINSGIVVEGSINKTQLIDNQKKLDVIEHELSELRLIKDIAARMIAEYKLLTKKISLINGKNIDYFIPLISRLNDLQIALRRILIVKVQNNDFASVKSLTPYVRSIPSYVYFECAKTGNGDVLFHLISEYKFNINYIMTVYIPNHVSIEFFGATLLLVATSNKKLDVFKQLLLKGANLDIANIILGMTPLMIATQDGLFEYVQLLLKNGANPNIACYSSYLALVSDCQILVNQIAMSAEQNNTGDTALHFACKKKYDKAIHLLLENHANPQQLNKQKLPPFFYLLFDAKRELHQESIKHFIDRGIDIDYVDPERNYTGLCFACQQNRIEDVKYLIANKSDPNKPCELISSSLGGNSPQQVNIVMKILSEQLQGDNKNHLTPLMKAAVKGFALIVSYLLEQQWTPVTLENVFNAMIFASLFPNDECISLLENKYQKLILQSNVNKELLKR